MTIWKFPFSVTDRISVQMPEGALVLHVECQQGGQPCIWAMVDPDAPTVAVEFRLFGTGHEVLDVGAHVATFQQGPFVWHLFHPSTGEVVAHECEYCSHVATDYDPESGTYYCQYHATDDCESLEDEK